MWVGFCAVEVLLVPLVGSPKFHDQAVKEPTTALEASVKVVAVPGHTVVLLKLGIGNGLTVTVLVESVLVQPALVVTVSVGVKVPAVK